MVGKEKLDWAFILIKVCKVDKLYYPHDLHKKNEVQKD